ncbi:MAG: hypothetical protein WA019_01300, partial [Candidatus Moraniibacteriota bacterium]
MLKFEQKINRLFPKKETPAEILSVEEKRSIEARADFRKRGQRFKIEMLNLSKPAGNEAMLRAWEKILNLVFQEAKGEWKESGDSKEDLKKKSENFSNEASENENLFPNFSAYLYSQSAKAKEQCGEDFDDELKSASECTEKSKDIPKDTPASFFADATLLGIQFRRIKKLPLPEKERIAQEILNDAKLLESYALVLPEAERVKFLDLIPKEKKKIISQIFDVSTSRFLHQSIVESKSLEEVQRRNVRLRLHKELRDTVAKGEKNDEQIVILLSEALGSLGEDSRQLLLELIRDEEGEGKEKKEQDYLSRILKVFLENFEDWRGNDIALKLAGDRKLNRHLSVYLLGKLIDNNYLSQDLKTWWSEEKAKCKDGVEAEMQSLEIVKSVITDLGVVPSREILNFISNDKKWKDAPLVERIEKIKASQEMFSGIENNRELVEKLSENENDAMIYYLLHGGDDRFNLINNYGFDKFKEMIGLIDNLKIHEKPIRKFKQSLIENGITEEEAEKIIENLRQGKFPLPKEQASQEVSFDVRENALVENANRELGQVLGRRQLGVIFLFPFYREYLEEDKNENLIEKMKGAQTFVDRLALIDEIEAGFPGFRERAHVEMKDTWRALGEKMVLDVSLAQVFSENSVPVRGEEILPKLDVKRLDLKKIKKELLVILKGVNEKESNIQKNIYKK